MNRIKRVEKALQGLEKCLEGEPALRHEAESIRKAFESRRTAILMLEVDRFLGAEHIND